MSINRFYSGILLMNFRVVGPLWLCVNNTHLSPMALREFFKKNSYELQFKRRVKSNQSNSCCE